VSKSELYVRDIEYVCSLLEGQSGAALADAFFKRLCAVEAGLQDGSLKEDATRIEPYGTFHIRECLGFDIYYQKDGEQTVFYNLFESLDASEY
jgi:hypothetical protein